VLGIGECIRLAADAGKACWWIAPSFASAAYQAGWRMVEFYRTHFPNAAVNLQRRALLFPSGGWLQFKTAEEPDALRGEALNFAVVDEAAHIPKLQEIWELCLRPTLLDRRGSAWFISTPRGFNYFNELWQKGSHSNEWATFQFASSDNPHLRATELESIAADMPSLVRRQEIGAEFVQLAGAMFRREWVRVLDGEPQCSRWVRCWDLAFTQKTTSDFTAGAKVGLMSDGTIVVSHIVHGRWEWPEAVRVVSSTARTDGQSVSQRIEVVGAQVGFLQQLQREPMLSNIAMNGQTVTKDKITRALPLAARAEQGKLAVVRGNWNVPGFMDELCAFPDGKHDDRVDCVSAALDSLASSNIVAVLI